MANVALYNFLRQFCQLAWLGSHTWCFVTSTLNDARVQIEPTNSVVEQSIID